MGWSVSVLSGLAGGRLRQGHGHGNVRLNPPAVSAQALTWALGPDGLAGLGNQRVAELSGGKGTQDLGEELQAPNCLLCL